MRRRGAVRSRRPAPREVEREPGATRSESRGRSQARESCGARCRRAAVSAPALRERGQLTLARVAPAQEQQREQPEWREVEQRELQELDADPHRMGTLIVVMYSSNSETRAVMCKVHVPGTLSSAPATV